MRYARSSVVLSGWLVLGLVGASIASGACPFCEPPGPTLTEELNQAVAAVVARRLPSIPENKPLEADTFAPSTFEILRVIKGPESLKPGHKLSVLHVGDEPLSTHFLIVAEADDELAWCRPLALSAAAETYALALLSLRVEGAERLKFFLPYLSHAEALLREDAYDEFARAPYEDVRALKPQLRRDVLLAGISDPECAVNLRRLYLTLLGVCGTSDDWPRLQAMITTDSRTLKPSLDAIIACWLTLRGAEGLPLIEERILRREDVESIDINAVVHAIRFHGEEERSIPRPRLAQTLRLVLDHPALADTVLADLARWEDWSVVERVADMFRAADEETQYIRVPILQYLKACPLAEAQPLLVELSRLDPKARRQADSPLPVVRRVTRNSADDGPRSR